MEEHPADDESRAPGTDEEIRQALVRLLCLMRPDWGTAKAVAGRVQFAQERLRLPLARVCAEAVRGAAIPGSPADVFIASTCRRPGDGAPADPDHAAELVQQMRRALVGKKPRSRRSGA